MESYKVLALKVQDFKNIDIIEVSFNGKDWIEVNGNNGSGKTSLIEALFVAMTGGKHYGRGFPAWRVIRRGENKALIKAVLGNQERTFEVRRSITTAETAGARSSGGSLSVKDQEGGKLGQDFLDAMLNEFTADPLEFGRKAPREQAEIMRRMAGIDESVYDRRRTEAAERRRLANADVKRLKAQTAEEPSDVQSVPVDDLVTDKERIGKENAARTVRNGRRKDADHAIERRAADIQRDDERIEQLKRELAALEANRMGKVEALEADQKARDALGEEEQTVSTETIDATLADAARRNAAAERRRQWVERKAELDDAAKRAGTAQADLDRVETDRKEALAKSKLPFRNIDFDDEVGVVIDGVPFSQKSTAEQIRISSRIAMELSTGLRVLCIRDGSVLDAESYAVLKELSEKHDWQILVERVGERQGEDRITLRAGRVISEFEPEETVGQKVRKLDDRL